MAAIQKSDEHTTAHAIVKWHEAEEAKNPPRPYLGGSIIGGPCDRALWYGFRQVGIKKFDGRMLRLFNRGHREEAQLYKELRGIGVEVYEVDPDTGEQFEVSAYGGHFSGHTDGLALGLPEAPKSYALLECKTYNIKSFAELKKLGMRKAKPTHFSQMTVYMGLQKLTRGLYFAACKDTDEIHTEWVHFDQAEFDRMMERAERIIFAKEPPDKIGDASHWQCKQCDFYALCHERAAPRKNCRTCVFATPVNAPSTIDKGQGQWVCEYEGKNEIPFDVQLQGCDEHLFIPPLISYAKPIDGGDKWVLYQHNDKDHSFINACTSAKNDPGLPELVTSVYTSEELAALDASMVGDPLVEEMKKELDAEVEPAC